MDIITYINKESLSGIPVLWTLGMALKMSSVPDKYIPIILVMLGVVWANLTLGISVASSVQGVLIGGAAIGINQTKKQLEKES